MPTAEEAIFAAVQAAGYYRCPQPLSEFRLLSNHVVVREQLTTTHQKLVFLVKQNAVMGTIVAVGPQATDEDGLQVGDTVLYEPWQGGRWCFPDPDADGGEIRCLIMRSEKVECIIRQDERSAEAVA